MIIVISKRRLLLAAAACCIAFLGSTAFLESQIAKPVFSASEAAALTVVLDPGHGGEDGGAVSPDGVEESGLNLEIALRLQELLRFSGVKTQMTRIADVSIHQEEARTIQEKKASDLRQRVEIVNGIPGAMLLSIHQNTYSDSRYAGAQVFYGASGESRQLAERTQETLRQLLDTENNRKAKPAETVYLMQNVQCTAILVECGFLSNEAEDLKLQSASYQKKLALAFGSSLNDWVLEETKDSEI